ncbi:hypothetical protein Tco_0300343 [Tanacetum coccineum]
MKENTSKSKNSDPILELWISIEAYKKKLEHINVPWEKHIILLLFESIRYVETRKMKENRASKFQYKKLSKRASEDILIRASRLKKVMADKEKKSSMETFAPNDKADYYSGITSITVNGKNAYELKGKFLDDPHNNAFSGTNKKDAVEHIEYYLKIIDPIKLPNVDHDKLRFVVFPISLAGGARRWFDKTKDLITFWVDLTSKFFGKYYLPSRIEGNNTPDYWKMGGDEIEVSDDESSNLEEYWSDKEEIAEIFKIETDIFDYETPLCLAFNEFNYLLKVDPDLLTKDIMGHGLIMEYERNRNQSNILPSLSTKKLGVQNGQPVVGERMVIVMEEICPELTILETRSITKTLNGEYENETHEEGHELCGIETREVSVCQIKRYKMIKYSFNDEEEYVDVKEDKYDDLTITRPWKQRISTNIGGEFTNLEDLEVLES